MSVVLIIKLPNWCNKTTLVSMLLILFYSNFRAEEMGDKARPESSKRYREDATGHLLCWGCGEFGQHGHGYKKEMTFQDGALEMFCGVREGHAKYVACGSSHTAVVTSRSFVYFMNFMN